MKKTRLSKLNVQGFCTTITPALFISQAARSLQMLQLCSKLKCDSRNGESDCGSKCGGSVLEINVFGKDCFYVLTFDLLDKPHYEITEKSSKTIVFNFKHLEMNGHSKLLSILTIEFCLNNFFRLVKEILTKPTAFIT